jgi:hypothetical protein
LLHFECSLHLSALLLLLVVVIVRYSDLLVFDIANPILVPAAYVGVFHAAIGGV